MYRILVINLGSTSTKAAVFEDEKEVLTASIPHDPALLASIPNIYDQRELRKQTLRDWLAENDYLDKKYDAVSARGGFTHPITSGTWQINQDMLDDIGSGKYGVHATNLSAALAYEFAEPRHIPCYVVDPSVIDERDPIAHISGCALLERRCVIHTLNQKYVARMAAAELGRRYEDCRLIVTHMGGGISMGLHDHGRIIDSNDGLNGDGTFSPERSGTLPSIPLIDLCFSGKYTQNQLRRLVTGEGGMISYTGTSDMRVLEKQAENDEHIRLLVDAMAYQIGKDLMSFTAVKGAPDAFVLTGGLAHSKTFTDKIRARVEWAAPVMVFPGEDENRSLALGVLRVLNGTEEAHIYAKY